MDILFGVLRGLQVLESALSWSELRPSTRFPPLVARGFRLIVPVAQRQSKAPPIITNQLSIKLALRRECELSNIARPVLSQGHPILVGWMWAGPTCVP